MSHLFLKGQYRSTIEAIISSCYSEACYLSSFPDIRAAVECKFIPSGLNHFIDYGRDEIIDKKRILPREWGKLKNGWVNVPSSNVALFATNEEEFDQNRYYNLFPDTMKFISIGHSKPAFQHWLEFGFAEVMSGVREIRTREGSDRFGL